MEIHFRIDRKCTNSTIKFRCQEFLQLNNVSQRISDKKLSKWSLIFCVKFDNSTLETFLCTNPICWSESNPSKATQRRNAKRREEFLKKKLKTATVQEKIVTDKESTIRSATFPCEQCGNTFKTESGLKIHIGRSHKLPPAEKLRNPTEAASLSASPLKDSARSISCHNCDEEMSPSHTCGEEGLGDGAHAVPGCTCDCELPICCNCRHGQDCSCCDDNPNSGVCNCEGYVVHH